MKLEILDQMARAVGDATDWLAALWGIPCSCASCASCSSRPSTSS